MIAHLTTALFLAAALFAIGAPVAAQSVDLADLPKYINEAQIIRIANEIDIAVDGKDWAKARSFFADEVRVDFTSLAGGEPATIKADELIGGWRANLGPKKTSLHLRGNHVVDIDRDKAVIRSHAYAWNRMEGRPALGGVGRLSL